MMLSGLKHRREACAAYMDNVNISACHDVQVIILRDNKSYVAVKTAKNSASDTLRLALQAAGTTASVTFC